MIFGPLFLAVLSTRYLKKNPQYYCRKKECEIFFFNFLAEKWKIHKIFEKNPQDFWPTFLGDFIHKIFEKNPQDFWPTFLVDFIDKIFEKKSTRFLAHFSRRFH